MRTPSLLTQFSLLSLGLFLGIGFALGWGLSQHIEQQTLDHQRQAASSLLSPAVAPFITDKILKEGAYGKDFSGIENAFTYLGGAGLVRVKIWNLDGMIAYSDQPELVGKYFPISDELAETFEGATFGDISELGKAENIDERGYGELMEVYAPLRLANEVEIKGAFEGYYDIDELRLQIEQTNSYLWASVMGGFLFLYISLFTIVRGASQRLVRQSRENALLLADTQRKALRLETVNELARSINQSSLDLDRVFQTALRGIDRIVPHSGASISLLNERTGKTVRRILSQAPTHDDVPLAGMDIETEKNLLGDKPWMICSDTQIWEGPGIQMLKDYGIKSFLAVPVSLGERMMGVLLVVSTLPSAFDEDDARILKGVADQLAVAIENMRLIKETAETTALRETNRLKDEFVSMVSHELRTPLASIKGYSHTLLAADGELDQETRHEFLDIISEESDKLTDLVENLLEMSRIGGGRLPITPEPVLLPRYCKGIVDRISKQHPEIELRCEIDEPMPVVEADPRRVEQVLINLLQNAAKYSGSDVITVRGRYDGGSEVVLSVEDCGKGIAPEHLPHLFDKFYRVDDGFTGEGAGSGLGLAIAKALVEAQRGRIWVESEPGKGTRFYFTLPALVVPGEGGEIKSREGAASGAA